MKILRIKHFVIFVTLCSLLSCKREKITLNAIAGKQIMISDSVSSDNDIETFVSPYRKRVNEVLDSTLAYAAIPITKDDGKYNTSAGNLMADIVFKEANPIFQARTGKAIDFVILNHGGIRSIISKGAVSTRTAYEVMPFENTIVVVELNGKSVRELVSFLIRSNRAHPISGIQIVIDKDDSLQYLNIQGKPFNEDQNYYVATNNYLVSGGDDMGFFKDGIKITETDYLVRNALIDHFKKVDTLAPSVDDRFYKLNQ